MSFYSIPSKIFIGNLDTEFTANVECRYPILIISSPSVIKISKVQSVIRLLQAHGEVSVYDSMKPDVPFTSLDEILTVYHGLVPSTIIAIGGGSVIDSAKAISISFSSGESYKKYFNTGHSLPTRTNTLVAVPTTAGTGAELSYGAILYDNENKLKGGIRGKELQPDVVFIDFSLYSNASSRLIAEVGFDCLTHAVETFISTASSPLVRYQSIAAIKMVFGNLEKAVDHDEIGIKNMAIASALMGINLALSSTCLPHRIQYIIGPETKTSHAQGLIALYKGWLTLLLNQSGPFEMLCNEIGITKFEFVAEVNRLKTTLNIQYSLSMFGIHENTLEYLAQRVTGNLSNDPYYVDKKTIVEILRKSL